VEGVSHYIEKAIADGQQKVVIKLGVGQGANYSSP
jgi:hypothetical protein